MFSEYKLKSWHALLPARWLSVTHSRPLSWTLDWKAPPKPPHLPHPRPLTVHRWLFGGIKKQTSSLLTPKSADSPSQFPPSEKQARFVFCHLAILTGSRGTCGNSSLIITGSSVCLQTPLSTGGDTIFLRCGRQTQQAKQWPGHHQVRQSISLLFSPFSPNPSISGGSLCPFFYVNPSGNSWDGIVSHGGLSCFRLLSGRKQGGAGQNHCWAKMFLR